MRTPARRGPATAPSGRRSRPDGRFPWRGAPGRARSGADGSEGRHPRCDLIDARTARSQSFRSPSARGQAGVIEPSLSGSSVRAVSRCSTASRATAPGARASDRGCGGASASSGSFRDGVDEEGPRVGVATTRDTRRPRPGPDRSRRGRRGVPSRRSRRRRFVLAEGTRRRAGLDRGVEPGPLAPGSGLRDDDAQPHEHQPDDAGEPSRA